MVIFNSHVKLPEGIPAPQLPRSDRRLVPRQKSRIRELQSAVGPGQGCQVEWPEPRKAAVSEGPIS